MATSSTWQPVQFFSRSPGSRVFPSAVVHGEPAGASDDALVTAEVVAVEFAPPVAAAGSSSPSSVCARLSYLANIGANKIQNK